MRYFVLATDYDGTLAEHGAVHPETLKAMKKLRETGRHIFLVTGRDLPDLISTFPEYETFEQIVAENGALLYEPRTKTETLLAQAPPQQFVNALREKGVHPLSVARVLVATSESQKDKVLDAIRE